MNKCPYFSPLRVMLIIRDVIYYDNKIQCVSSKVVNKRTGFVVAKRFKLN